MLQLAFTSFLATLILSMGGFAMEPGMEHTVLGYAGLGCITGIFSSFFRFLVSAFVPVPAPPLPTPVDVVTLSTFGLVVTFGASVAGESGVMTGFNYVILAIIGLSAYAHLDRSA